MVFVIGGLLIWSFSRYAGYQETAIEMADLDDARRSESFSLDTVVFGGTTTATSTVSLTSSSSTATEIFTFDAGMNFTTGVGDWAFTRTLPSGVSQGMSAGHDPNAVGTGAVGSSSGAGVIFIGVSYNPSSGTKSFIGNWTTRFYVDVTRFGVSSGNYLDSLSSAPTMEFSYGRVLPSSLWNDGVSSISQRFYLVNSTGGSAGTYSLASKSYASSGDADSSWTYTTGVDVTGGSGSVPYTFWGKGGSPQWVSLVIFANITMKNTLTPAEVRIYFDDVGLLMSYPAHTATTTKTLSLGSEERGSIIRFDVSLTSAYNRSIYKQLIYVRDQTTSTDTLFHSSSIGTTSTAVSFSYDATDVLNYISSSKTVVVVITTINPSAFRTTTGSLELTDFFSDTSKVTVVTRNTGESSIHLVSLWIIDSTSHSNYKGSGTFDVNVAAGTSEITTVTHTWVSGTNIVKIVTERGNIVTRTVSA
jgi:hypothetical protein